LRKLVPFGHITNLLAAYRDGALDPAAAQRVTEHLARCRRCRQAQEALARASASLVSAPILPAPDRLWAKVESSLEHHQAGFAANRPRRLYFASVGSLAALTLLAAALVAFHLRRNPGRTSGEPAPLTASWRVERLAGTPVIGATAVKQRGRLGVGESLTTDARSRARVEVADIGQVEIAPNSEIRLMQTQRNLHRLSLDRGELSAHVVAPPRLFFVDTPSARAVDLGCSYTLTVDPAGNSRLRVTGGHVALVLKNRETEVPAGAVCLTRKGVGAGTPFFGDASAAFQAAVARYDFADGGDNALRTIVKTARSQDVLTLWNLLSRVSPDRRPLVIDGLLRYVDFPPGVTRDGIARLEPQMLARWKERMDID
jgi:hypothetical protein